jgi:hypothetical protein
MQVVQDPAATTLAAELLLQGPGVWPFGPDRQSQLVTALASVLPSMKAVSITSATAPFRRRLLQVGTLLVSQLSRNDSTQDEGDSGRTSSLVQLLLICTSGKTVPGFCDACRMLASSWLQVP